MAAHLPALETRMRQFLGAIRDSTLPAALKDAAMANLSTLATPTCFRTADGKFRGFEGINDNGGCCHGNCTHVWNYETATAHLFPSFSRSLRRAAFGYSMDDRGAMYFRQLAAQLAAQTDSCANFPGRQTRDSNQTVAGREHKREERLADPEACSGKGRASRFCHRWNPGIRFRSGRAS